MNVFLRLGNFIKEPSIRDGSGQENLETRQDRDKVLNFFRDKTRRDIISRQIHSRQPKTAKGMSRQDKTYNFL